MPVKITISDQESLSDEDIKLIESSFSEIPLKEIFQ